MTGLDLVFVRGHHVASGVGGNPPREAFVHSYCILLLCWGDPAWACLFCCWGVCAGGGNSRIRMSNLTPAPEGTVAEGLSE